MINVQKIRDQIQSAAEKAGRDPDEITLLGASKYADVKQVRQAYDQGLACFGENRSEGLAAKKDLLPDDISWHFIGQLQTNKVKYIIDNVELIHSLDRLSLAKELQKRAMAKQTTVNALVEVRMDDRETRGGIQPKEVLPFLEQCAQFDRLFIHGLMCVAPVSYTQLTILFETAYTATAFNTLLLQEQGFSSTQVGVILAVFSIVGIIAPPFWGYLADKDVYKRQIL